MLVVLEANTSTPTAGVAARHDALPGAVRVSDGDSAGTRSRTGEGGWVNVTPRNMPLTAGGCDSYGTQTVVGDRYNPSDLYVEDNCQGIWESPDYGRTWTGPINTGANGQTVGDCAGGIALSSGGVGHRPTLYESCIRGPGVGFWRSMDGGADWTKYLIGSHCPARMIRRTTDGSHTGPHWAPCSSPAEGAMAPRHPLQIPGFGPSRLRRPRARHRCIRNGRMTRQRADLVARPVPVP